MFFRILKLYKLNLDNLFTKSNAYRLITQIGVILVNIFIAVFQVLNDKFSGDIEKDLPDTFPDKYFTCRSQCLSCK